MFEWFKKSASEPLQPLPTRVEWDAELVRVFAGEIETKRFRWADLTCIYAFKQDCCGFDRIWVAFDATGLTEPSLVHEAMDGYAALIAEMQRRCTGFRPDWWTAVALPAFAENFTIIWQAPPTSVDRPTGHNA